MPDEITPPVAAPAVTPAAPIAAPVAAAAPAASPPAAAPSATAAAPAAAPPAAASTKPAKTIQELLAEKGPDEAQKRIARAARKALKAFGIDVAKDADINAEADRFMAQRETRRTERKDLLAKAAEVDAYKATVDAYAAAELKGLTDEQRAFVTGVAPSDTRVQLAHIAALKASGAIKPKAAEAAPQAPPVAAAPSPIPPPAQSASTQPGPVPTSPGAPDHLATYRSFDRKTPAGELARSLYLTEHPELLSALLRPQS